MFHFVLLPQNLWITSTFSSLASVLGCEFYSFLIPEAASTYHTANYHLFEDVILVHFQWLRVFCLFVCSFDCFFFFFITIWAIRIIFLIKLNIQLNKYQLFLSFCSPCSDLKQKLNGGALPYMRRNKFIASKHKKEFIFFFSFLFFSQRWKNHFQVRFSCMFIVVLMIQCDNTQRGLCQETNILRDKDVLKLKS